MLKKQSCCNRGGEEGAEGQERLLSRGGRSKTFRKEVKEEWRENTENCREKRRMSRCEFYEKESEVEVRVECNSWKRSENKYFSVPRIWTLSYVLQKNSNREEIDKIIIVK